MQNPRAVSHSNQDKIVTGCYSLDTPEEGVFRSIVTLDPQLSRQAWDRLSIDVAAVEYSELPRKLHLSFIKALIKARISSQLH